MIFEDVYFCFDFLLNLESILIYIDLVLGLSLKTQELTAIFLLARLGCSFSIEKDIHTALDFATLASTLWVIYMIRFKLKFTYIVELDNLPLYYVVRNMYIYHVVEVYNRAFVIVFLDTIGMNTASS